MSVLQNGPTVDVWCRIERKSANLIWVSNGTIDMNLDGKKKLIELPRSHIHINGYESVAPFNALITMPEALARERGLIQ